MSNDDLSEDELNALSEAMGGDMSGDDIVAAEAKAEAEKAAADTPPPTPPPTTMEEPQGSQATAGVGQIARAQFMQLDELAASADIPPQELERMADVNVRVEVILGETKQNLEDILKFQPGSVIELDKLAGEPVDVTANGQVFARAEVVVIDDNFGIKILDIVGTQQKLSVIQS